MGPKTLPFLSRGKTRKTYESYSPSAAGGLAATTNATASDEHNSTAFHMVHVRAHTAGLRRVGYRRTVQKEKERTRYGGASVPDKWRRKTMVEEEATAARTREKTLSLSPVENPLSLSFATAAGLATVCGIFPVTRRPVLVRRNVACALGGKKYTKLCHNV